MSMQMVKQNRKQTGTFINVTVGMLIIMNLLNLLLSYVETVVFSVFGHMELCMDLIRLFGAFGIIVLGARCFGFLLEKR